MAFGSKRQWNWRNFFMCFMVSLGQIAFGYPASIIGVTLAQPSFLIYMGLLDVTQEPPVMTRHADELIGAISGVGLYLWGKTLADQSRYFKLGLLSVSSLQAGLQTNGDAKWPFISVASSRSWVARSYVEAKTSICSLLVDYLPELEAGAFCAFVRNSHIRMPEYTSC
jgi:hypothetical protein